MVKKNTIKVLQVFGSLNMGGAESRMMDIFRRIDISKCQFDFVSLSEGNQYFEVEIKSLGGHIYKVPSPRKCGILRHIYYLRRCIRLGKYQAVHAHTSYHCGIVMFAAWLEGVPVRIAHARTTGSKQLGKSKKVIMKIGQILIERFATHKYAISKEAGEFLFSNHDFTVIPNAIELIKYQNIDKIKVRKLKKELNIPEDYYVIGQIGRFEAMKNHEFTIRWFSDFIKTHNSAMLVFVGDGSLREKIERLSEKFLIRDKVVFTGIRADVNELIHTFDVLFFPSLFEGLGGVAIEAQAAGIPCVVSDRIPLETDLGLGLVKRCSLEGSLGDWTRMVEDCLNIQAPTAKEIWDKFNKAGYNIECVAKKYLSAYEGI